MNKRMTSGNPWWVWLSWSLLVIVLDQLSKIVIVSTFGYGQGQFVTSFFNFVRVHNTGAAFSLLAGAGGWQRWFFVGLGLVAVTFMVWLMRAHPQQKLFCFALASILGGAIGNIIDRLWHGYVVDFLDFHWSWLAPLFHGGHFPAFNLADSAITLGTVLLIWDEIRRVRRS